MAKRRRSPPLPSCYSSRLPPENGGNDGGVNVQYEYNDNDDIGNLGVADPFLPYVEHHDGRRFWSDRFYLNANNANANANNANPIETTTTTSAASSSSSSSSSSLCDDCNCGSLRKPPTFPLIDFVNQSLDLKASVMGTFNIHPEWFRQNFPRFCERRRKRSSSSDERIGTKDCNNDSNNDSNKSAVDRNTTVPTFILHGHRGLENALAKRVLQADEMEYETDRDEDDDISEHLDKSKSSSTSSTSSKHSSPRHLTSIEQQSSKFQFFLPNTAKVTETARHFVRNPDLQLCQVHCNWEKSGTGSSSTSKTSPVVVRVSSDKENSEHDDEKIKTATTRETKLGVHHPKFLLLFEQSGDLVVIVTTSNLTPTNQSTVEGSWVQRFRRKRSDDHTYKEDGSYRAAKRNRNSIPRNSNYQQQQQQQQKGQENDFGPVLQDFLVQLSEAAAAGPKQTKMRETIPLANSNKTHKNGNRESSSSSNRLPLEEFLSKHIGLESLSEFSELYHFETAQTYLVPIVPGDYKYDPCDSSSTSTSTTRGESPTRFYYGRQRVRYILDELATSTPKISKKTQDKSKSDRLLLQPTSLGNDWSRSQFASLVREYMGYYGGGSTTNKSNNNAIAQNGENTKMLAKRKTTPKKKKTNNDYSYHRDDFWVCRQADIVWPSDQFMVDIANSLQSFESNGANNFISPLQAAATTSATTRCDEGGESPTTRTTVMNSFCFNSSRTFNGCDLEFIARMAKYQPSTPCQLSHRSSKGNTVEPVVSPRAPHFKSIARLFQNHVAMQKRDVPPADAYFSWFLLTSACLSTGAQGAVVVDDVSDRKTDKSYDYSSSSSPSTSDASTVAYRNFELGVLFASHLPKKSKPSSKTKGLPATIDSRLEQEKQRRSVVYCFHPQRCSCGDKNTINKVGAIEREEKTARPQLVHLPVPYNLRPESYFQEHNNNEEEDGEDDTEMVMKENPFFHEISDESRCIGNMLLTPFGQREINQTKL